MTDMFPYIFKFSFVVGFELGSFKMSFIDVC